MNIKQSLVLFFCVISLSAHSFDKAKLEQYLQTLEANNKAMLSVAIVENGRPIYQKSIGFSDVSSAKKANQETQYRIGSITKTFTATMIFQLIEEGKLTLETKLVKFYPKVKNAEHITISMLLNHQSGIHNFTNQPDFKKYMTKPKTKAEMLNIIHSQGSDFEPGTQANYSNSGYVLLGFIIQDITNDTYANQLQIRIVEKLNLKRTRLGGAIEVKDNQANSYIYTQDSWLVAPESHMSIPHAAGAIISTPTDVARFLSGLFAGKLVSTDSLAKMQELERGFGRGLSQFPFYEKKAYGHEGAIDGFKSIAGYFEQDKVAFALISNGLNINQNDISIAILSSYFERPFDIPDFSQKAIQLPEQDLTNYEGTYATQSMPLKITFKVDDGQLYAQATGQRALKLTAYSKTEFRFEKAGIVMVFATNGDEVDYATFVLKQGGGQYIFTRE